MARPKGKGNKIPINLSVDKEAVERGKKTAEELNKSLSQYTEDVYNEQYGLVENPEEAIKTIEQMLKKVKSKLSEKNKKS